MTIANDIIGRRVPDFDRYLAAGESLNNTDEYGFNPLIETAITRQPAIAEQLIARGVDVNNPDVTGRTALHWTVDNQDLEFTRLLLGHGANPNAYTRAGLSVLVYPVLREQNELKQLLYQHGAKLDFALDFINAKLLGHRFEMKGYVDIVNAKEEFIELDYEGFILEFTVAAVNDSLRRFTSSYSTRHLRSKFPYLYEIMDAFTLAEELLQMQCQPILLEKDHKRLMQLAKTSLLILPAASRGHAMSFIYYRLPTDPTRQFWAKIDRGENSLKEGSVNIYEITRQGVFTGHFLQNFLFKRQDRNYFHKTINKELGLILRGKMPVSSQITGNCSWANIQAVVPVAYALQEMALTQEITSETSLSLYDIWVEWDKDRTLDECIQRFYLANPIRRASIAAQLGGVLFQSCDDAYHHHVSRAEKILAILTLPEYSYILRSYLDTYCVKRLTRKGNNLLKLLDDCGINPDIGVNPVATGL